MTQGQLMTARTPDAAERPADSRPTDRPDPPRPVAVRFDRMTPREFVEFRESDTSNNEEQIRTGLWSRDEAPALARKEFDERLPQGLDTPDHYLVTIRSGPDDRPVGCAWYTLSRRATLNVVYIHWLGIRPEAEGHGYATAAISRIESEARRLGASRLVGVVWGENPGMWEVIRRRGGRITTSMYEKEVG
jgi:RimJ/RimL family protein N-acetyltransferase